MKWVFAILLVPALSCAADVAAGKTAYEKACKNCHGADGTPNAAVAKMMKVEMAHLGAASVKAKPDADHKKAITEGVGKMKPIKSVAPADVDNIVAYMKTFKG